MNSIYSKVFVLILAAYCANAAFVRSYAQVTSTFLPNMGSTDWFNPINWDNGIPNGAGDTAQIPGMPITTTAEITAPVTLGQLVFLNGGFASVSGNQTLSFNTPGLDPAFLHSQSTAASLGVPISIASEVLRIATTGSVELTGPIVSSSGEIIKDGTNALSLKGDNSMWDGPLTVNAGTLIVNHAKGLGSGVGHTSLLGGTIVVNQATEEPMTLSAGELQTSVSFLDFSGQLNIPVGSAANVRGPFSLRGGSIGGGDMHLRAERFAAIRVMDAPLAHSGGLSVMSAVPQRQFAEIHVDNSYQGLTNVNNVRLQVRTAGGLGTSDTGTKVTNGELWLHPGSKEDVELDSSTLVLWRGDPALTENQFNGRITLRSGSLSTVQQFGAAPRYTVSHPVVLLGGLNSIAPNRGELILNGIQGQGDLLMNAEDDIFVVGLVEHQGSLEFRNGPVHLAAPNVVVGTVLVRNGGRLIAEANQHLDRVMTGPRDESCCGTFGSIEAAPGIVLQVDTLNIFEGLVKGDVRTNRPIEFHGFGASRDIRNLVSGTNVVLHAGQMELDDSDTSLDPTSGAVIVGRVSESVVQITSNPSTVNADFYLNNGTGFGYGGALRFETNSTGNTETTLAGDIYLGDRGANVGGEAQIRVEGQIFGGDLILGTVKTAGPYISLVTTPHYTGKTSIRSGELALTESGRLVNTSQIDVVDRGRLAVDTLPSDGALSDRISDDIPIHMYGGELSVWPTAWGMNTTERVGQVFVKRGINVVRGTDFFVNSLQSNSDLRIGELSREHGSIVSLTSIQRRASTRFTRDETPGQNDLILENPPPLVNGMLPAWLIAGPNFTTIDQSGRVRSFDGPTPTFEDANETSVVRPPQSASSLSRDMRIHALYAFGNVGPVDLNGHTLTVGSGGISGAQLSNGTIRPGSHSVGELIFVGGVNIAANIVDNGTPTSVTYASEATVSGTNTYTGTTFVVGEPGDDVRIMNGEALPTGGDIEVSGWGRLFLRDRSGYHYNLGTITLRDGGTLAGQCCDNLSMVTARRIELESGELSVALEGNTPVVKTTDGVAIIATSVVNNAFVGTVDVHDGLLIAGGPSSNHGYLAFGRSTVTVHSNGRLALSPANTGINAPPVNITLNGGALYGGTHPQSHQLNLVGNINVVDHSKIYMFDGTATDLRQSDLKITGRLNVVAGKSLELLGRAYNSLGPELILSDGLHLEPGAVLAGDGAVRSRIEISNGAILSPGTISSGVSIGALAMSRPTWGEGGRYRWEINDAAGDAGSVFGNGWDIALVRGELAIDATAESPFVIELIGMDSISSDFGIANLTNGQFRWQFVEADSIVGFDPSKFVIDASRFFNDASPETQLLRDRQ